jgi:hypothetical protein
MVVAVLTAIYCRRRRRQRLLKQSYMYSGRGTAASSSSQIVPAAISRIPSQASMRENTRASVANPVYLTTPNTEYDLYAQMEKEQQLQYQHQMQMEKEQHLHQQHQMQMEREHHFQQQQQQLHYQQQQQQQQFQQQIENGTASVKITRSVPIVTKESEFDNFSFTLNDGGKMATTTLTEAARHERFDMMEQNQMYQRTHAMDNAPYTIKTNANMGSIVAGSTTGGMSQYSNESLKGIYRAVEYTKSPRIERVRVKNSEDFDDFDQQQSMDYAAQNYRIDTREGQIRVSDIDNNNGEFNHLEYRTPMNNDEKTFVVKLFPVDEHEKEVQEMTMFVESSEHHTRKY